MCKVHGVFVKNVDSLLGYARRSTNEWPAVRVDNGRRIRTAPAFDRMNPSWGACVRAGARLGLLIRMDRGKWVVVVMATLVWVEEPVMKPISRVTFLAESA